MQKLPWLLVIALMLSSLSLPIINGIKSQPAAAANCSVIIVFNITASKDAITGMSIYESSNSKARGFAPWLFTGAAGIAVVFAVRKNRQNKQFTS